MPISLYFVLSVGHATKYINLIFLRFHHFLSLSFYVMTIFSIPLSFIFASLFMNIVILVIFLVIMEILRERTARNSKDLLRILIITPEKFTDHS